MREKNNGRETADKKGKQDSFVTKESLTAVCALFSLLTLLILFTDRLIFGEIGEVVNDFLLGSFGYFVYPIFVAVLYVSATSFFDKRFVKNRYVFTAFIVAVVCALIVLQTALTYSWELENYAEECFSAGSAYSTATLLGWSGGLVIALFSSFLTKIGTMILFAVLCFVAIYFVAIGFTGKQIFKRGDKKEKKVAEAREEPSSHMEYPNVGGEGASYDRSTHPSTGEYPNPYPPMQREFGATYAPQQPRFRIGENGESGTSAQSQSAGGYSPFGYGKSVRPQPPREPISDTSIPSDPAGRKEFLLNGTNEEIYRRNLIYDGNSRVNNRHTNEGGDSVSPERGVGSSFSDPSQPTQTSGGFSSYTHSYEEGFGTAERPAKIVTERTPMENRGYENYTPPVSPTTETPPTLSSEEPSYRGFDRTTRIPESPSVTETFGTDRGIDRGIERGFDGGRLYFDESRSGESATDNSDFSTEEILPRESVRGGERLSDNGFDENFNVDTSDSFMRREEEFPRRDLGSREEYVRDIGDPAVRDSFFTDRKEGKRELGSPQFRGRDSVDDEDPLKIFEDDEEDQLNGASDEKSTFRSKTESPSFVDRSSTVGRRDLGSVRFSGSPLNENNASTQVPSETPKPPKPRFIRPYTPAPLNYMDCSDIEPTADSDEIEQAKEKILMTYANYGINNITISSVTFGPTITRYNFVAPRTIAHSKLATPDIQKALAMELRCSKGINIFPNYDDGVISIEVPNKDRQPVQLGCLLTGPEYINATPTSLVFAIGKDVGNKKLYGDVCKMTHLLVAGSTGSGKSVFLTTLIISLINHYSPQQLRLILIDPKKTEFAIYQNLPHLMINEIITEPKKAIQSLGWAIGEMNRRFELFAQMTRKGTRVVNLDEYNAHLPEGEEKLPKIVIIVDELADLMLSAKKEVEERIQNITQKSRAAGIHMVIATQRPSTNVITGVIKANLPTRIAFTVATDVDSRVILDATGAQKLLGRGDMLYSTSGQPPIRAQCAFISSEDTQNVVDYIRSHNDSDFNDEATDFINGKQATGESEESGDGNVEQLYIEALKIVVRAGQASISMIQRKFAIGYTKAGKIVEWMEDMGYVSSFDGAKARKCLLSKEEFENLYGPL